MINEEIVYAPISKIEKDSMTVYGAGKFGESKLILDKTRAALLFVEISKFLDIKWNEPTINTDLNSFTTQENSKGYIQE